MKLVIGIVRPEKANDVLESLFRAKVRGVSISRVQGHGGELDRVETYRGTTVKMGLSEKVRFEIAVSDEFVKTTVDALREGGRTDDVGDGKIMVVPLDQVVRIRTGETDKRAVTPVGGPLVKTRKPAAKKRKPAAKPGKAAAKPRKPAAKARKPATRRRK